MRSDLVLLASIAAMVLCGGVRADLKVLDKPLWVFPGQQFRVCLEQPAGSGELEIEVPETLEMFDTWDQDAIQRYYFRALKAGDATLRFSGKGGTLEMPLEVLGWNDVYQPRKYKEIELPRLWPRQELGYSALKSRRTMHSAADLAQLRAEGKVVGRAERWLNTPDEEVYNIIPGPSVPRTCLLVLGSREANNGIGKGCPVCGTKIYEGRSGFYPWKFNNAEHPWKVICPECGTAFPSNDWRAGDMHSGPFPDDGFGCEPVDPPIAPDGGKWRWPFIAYYHQWQAYMGELTPGIIESARSFAATGEQGYAHKSAIALLRMAEAMVDMSLNLNHRKIVNRDGILQWPVGAPLESRGLAGSFLYIQCNWGNPRIENAARAWDLIFDQLDDDKELIEFCQTHNHPEIQSIADFKRFIETGILRVPIQAAMDNAVARNWPQQEMMAANLALCLGTEKTTEVADWLLNANGIRFALTNLFYRDGAAYESPGYNHGHISRMADIGVILDKLQALHPEVCKPPQFVSATQHPKFRQIYDFPLDSGLIGRTYPPVGDAGKGGPSNVLKPAQGIPCDLDDWMTAYRVTQDPRFAQAMYGPEGSLVKSISDPELRAAAEQAGRELGWQVQVPSNLCDGYGLAILRSGEGANQRAIWMRYARNLQHVHEDMLTYGIAGLRRELLPELGYPEGWTYSGHWESNWGTHYGTKISGVRSSEFNRAELTTFVGQPPVQIAAAESTAPFGDALATRQRTIALIDLGPQRFYCLTVERVQGGEEHHCSLHGPDGEATAENLSLQPYQGTALGEGLEYKDFSPVKAQGLDPQLSCLAFMYDPAKATPQRVWSLDCLLRNQDNVHLRMTSVYPEGGELIVAKGKPPGGRKLYEMTWAVLKCRGESPLTRQYLNVVEPYIEQAAIRKTERVAVSGGDEEAQFPPLALRVTTDEFVDTIIIQHKAGTEVSADGISFDGEFGLWREQNGQLHTAALVRGTKLLKNQEGITLTAAEYSGEITACDLDNRTITIEPAPADPSALAGRHIRITNAAGNSVSYQVQKAEAVEGACRLSFALDPRIGEGFVKECRDGVVTSSIYLKLYPYGYYAGKTLANETGEVLYRLRNVSKYDCLVARNEGEDVPAAKLQAEFGDPDGDGLSRFIIYDYGPGDSVTMENYATLSKQGPHTLRLQQGGGTEEITLVVKTGS